MARKRKLLIMPQLKDCGGDLNKKWYVEYSLRDPQTGEMKRFRHYDGFSELKSEMERRVHADKIIAEIKLKLEKGDDPFGSKIITYQDELIYQTTASRWGKEREAIICVRTYLSEFLEMKEAELAHSSYQTYKSKLRIFCEWLENNKLDEKNLGELIYFFEKACAMSGMILGVNPFNQPGVEKYKKNMSKNS